MQLKITATGVSFPENEFYVHFPNVSRPAVLAQSDLDALGLEIVPDPEPLPLTPEELADQLAVAKMYRNLEIKAERDRRKLNGVFVQDKWIHSDTYSRTQWMAMVMMGASIPSIEWTTMDGTSITTSQTLAGQVFQACAQLDAAVFFYAKTLMNQVDASTDPGSIDITTGWPATYEGAP